MIDSQKNVPSVALDEVVRFIMQGSHIRQDHTLKPDAFILHPWPDLSVSRHRDASELELWAVGRRVAQEGQRTLRGRADVQTAAFLAQQLQVNADPIPTNPNHAIVVGWPAEKAKQKLLALCIARASIFQPIH